jgi:hypothetical protein
MSEALTPVEAGTLQAYEKAIERGLQSFVEVGRALMQIRDSKLYRATHATFEDYCEGRWQMSKSRAYQVMEASGVAERVQNSGRTLPPISTASHAEALAELPDDEQAEAYEEAVETAPDGKVTAEHVAEVVEKRKPSKPSAPKPNTSPLWDEVGRCIDRALEIYRKYAQECDESADVIADLERSQERHGYYVRGIETV